MSETETQTVKHPARFTAGLFPIFDNALKPLIEWKSFGTSDDATYGRVAPRLAVLDPFGGIGLIHQLGDMGPYETYGIEIEPEWAKMHPKTQVGNALALPFEDGTFDAIVTSPTYGNRFADSHVAKDGSERRSYTHDLGHALNEANSGAMHWGATYREFHSKAWVEARRVLKKKEGKKKARLVLNCKDHIRNFERQYVCGWHVTTLTRLGFDLLYHEALPVTGMRKGQNSKLRVDAEQVYVFELAS